MTYSFMNQRTNKKYYLELREILGSDYVLNQTIEDEEVIGMLIKKFYDAKALIQDKDVKIAELLERVELLSD
jgi:hypothetical protein